MLDKEPRIEWTDLVAGGLIYLGLLMFLVAFHILTINATDADTQSVLNTLFIVLVTLYSGAVIFGLVGAIAQILKWLTWAATTPNWKKKKIRGQQ